MLTKNNFILLKFIFLIWIHTIISSCISVPQQNNTIAPGVWRGTIILEDARESFVTRGIDEVITRDPYPESKKRIVPFTFELTMVNEHQFYIEVINGQNKIKFDQIEFGHDIKTGNDTFVIHLTPYDAVLKGIYEHNRMDGHFIVNDKINYSIPFSAKFGHNYRFEKLPIKTNLDISGKWQTVFAKDSSDQYNAIGEFVQHGNIVEGTFRTETGDYGYLAGELSDHKLSLSIFDGAHAFLFEGMVDNDQINGHFYSGKHYKTTFTSKKTNQAQLVNADSLTQAKANVPFIFSFPNTKNELISNTDPKYKNKIKLIQITVTWCPNCRDESHFIVDYLTKNPDPEIAVICLAFERKSTQTLINQRLDHYKNNMNIPYEILYAGVANIDSASAALPQLSGIKSFPTLLFLDRNNVIYKIHTGFDGPATSQYTSFVEDFKMTIQQLKNKKS